MFWSGPDRLFFLLFLLLSLLLFVFLVVVFLVVAAITTKRRDHDVLHVRDRLRGKLSSSPTGLHLHLDSSVHPQYHDGFPNVRSALRAELVMHFEGFSFGLLRIDGVVIRKHDVLIDRGRVRKSKKKASK
jgi:hypothetical protein